MFKFVQMAHNLTCLQFMHKYGQLTNIKKWVWIAAHCLNIQTCDGAKYSIFAFSDKIYVIQ
jgi:hypothetical protein